MFFLLYKQNNNGVVWICCFYECRKNVICKVACKITDCCFFCYFRERTSTNCTTSNCIWQNLTTNLLCSIKSLTWICTFIEQHYCSLKNISWPASPLRREMREPLLSYKEVSYICLNMYILTKYNNYNGNNIICIIIMTL